MKNLVLFMAVLVSVGISAQNTLTVSQSKQLEKTADSLACAANHLLLGCFEKWDVANYDKSISYFKQAKVMYERLMKDGTAQTTELAELLALMVQTRISLIESSLMFFDESFARKMGNPGDEKMTKKKYNGSVLLIPKSQDYKFDNVISNMGVYCE
jgi:hypothetical protein